ncbi:MAG: signal recognition particle receptor subunit alpha [Candidatus Aenigmatarchaeota archaeon]
MVLEKLGLNITQMLRKLTGRTLVDKAAVEEFLKELQASLLGADANVQLAMDLTNRIKTKTLEQPVPPGLTLKEHMIKTVYDELVAFMGKEPAKIDLKKQRILMVGLFGAGKTTTAGKLAKFFLAKGLKPALIGCDAFRPAAQEQIKQLGAQIGVPSYAQGDDASKTAIEAMRKFGDKDVLIFDSAGRNALDEALAAELKKLGETIKPDEVLLVIPADIGQIAGRQATEFNKLVRITGIIVTKLDGTAKGGGALSSCAALGVPIKFVGTGEKTEALEPYDPKRLVSRLIGYGDLQGLVEKAKEAQTDKSKESAERIVEGKFTMEDFYEQMVSMQKLGPLKQVMKMVPGVQIPEELLGAQEGKMKKWTIAIQSMTKEEKENPEIIDAKRIERISKGSGVSQDEVRELLRYFNQSKKLIKMFGGKSGNAAKLAKQFGLRM